MFKNYIWDFDGTLFDTYPILLDSIVTSLSQDFDVQADPSHIYYLLKSQSSAAVSQEYSLDFDDFTKKFKIIETADKRKSQPFEGAVEVLTQVVEKQGQNFILTHRTLDSTKEILKEEGMDHLIVEIIGSEEGFPRKPDPASLNYFLEKYQLDPKETVMVGDRRLDVEAGINAGIATIFFDVEDLLKDVVATKRVKHMKEILSLIE